MRKPILLTAAAVPTALAIAVAVRFMPAIPSATTQPAAVVSGASTAGATPVAPAAAGSAKPQLASIQPQGPVKPGKGGKGAVARTKARKEAKLHATAARPAVRPHKPDGSNQ